MSDFASDLERFVRKVEQRRKDIFAGVVAETKNSITDGSALTGAPGQPVDTGFLKGSWQAVFEGPDTALVGTNVSYAPAIESGIRSDYDPRGVDNPKPSEGPHRKSLVGGPHSVNLTRANFPRLVEAEVRKAVGSV